MPYGDTHRLTTLFCIFNSNRNKIFVKYKVGPKIFALKMLSKVKKRITVSAFVCVIK